MTKARKNNKKLHTSNGNLENRTDEGNLLLILLMTSTENVVEVIAVLNIIKRFCNLIAYF
jgi:hypothetical protein